MEQHAQKSVKSTHVVFDLHERTDKQTKNIGLDIFIAILCTFPGGKVI